VTSNRPFDFGADQDPRFLIQFSPLQDRGNCKNSTAISVNNDYNA